MKIKFTEIFLKTMVRLFGAKGFSKMYAATSTSKAYAKFCERVYGRDLCQANMMDEEQLQFLLDKLQLNENHDVLDLGCGIGKISEYISDVTKAKVTGIDFAFGAIEQAQQRTNQIKFVVGNLNNLKELVHEKYDVIALIDSLYFVDDIHNYIMTLRRFLKPGGTIAIFYTSSANPNKVQEILSLQNFTFCSHDFTANERKIWERSLIVAEELKEEFIKEKNIEIYKGRISEAKRNINAQKTNTIFRYLYLIK
ncbi:class I SAM-dependent methyltransferase [Bacteriovorax sp. PP10]|uniref:Class I SAM-dependent methyltransferase n=1 Tax=Bacteriovorax antarcticus TaxID=3088717 RepID=A0ABU5VXA1_9BACT|nr:class I SAM-dependent methyltransferase [Bacteriovorax sp. PP10]MEA9356265.1 class I SAM-dependent methyltransferase [Bacteriovorax sp. PP10]